MVYDIYNYSIHGVYNQLISGGAHIAYFIGMFPRPNWRPWETLMFFAQEDITLR